MPALTVALNFSLIAARWFVNTKVVPLASERRTAVIGVSGRVTPGLAATMRGSFQLVTSPRKISG